MNSFLYVVCLLKENKIGNPTVKYNLNRLQKENSE